MVSRACARRENLRETASFSFSAGEKRWWKEEEEIGQSASDRRWRSRH